MMRSRLRSNRVDIVALGLSAVGVTLLLARLWLPPLGGAGRLAVPATILVAILAGSMLVPARRDLARLHPVVVLAIGLGAVALALGTGGRPMPAPYAAWAIPLAVLAAVAEEALFRRAAYGALARHGAMIAAGVTAVAFALVHLPLYGVAAFPVDLGAGMLLSWQRWAAGTWTVPAATHTAANLVMTVLR
ncbi:MAG: CPBP family glutamic-type intramembrane protease [Thermoleophilia bacterium]|nr:CPBP family glutamic-type intramembrane protease [Thermoleophilia bacterium]